MSIKLNKISNKSSVRHGIGFLSAVILLVCVFGLTVFLSNKNIKAVDTSWYSGLWKTGLRNVNQRMDPAEPDPHWSYTGVENSGYNDSVKATCQDPNSYTWGWSSISYSGRQAMVIYDVSDKYQHGGLPPVGGSNGSSATSGVGVSYINEIGATRFNPITNNNDWVWQFQHTDRASGSRWIGPNAYSGSPNFNDTYRSARGQHLTSSKCKDPTLDNGTDDSNMRAANIFKFKLTNDFNIFNGKNTDIKTVRLNLKIDSDNWFRVKINGSIITNVSSPNGFAGTGWINPDYSSNSLANIALDAGMFLRTGSNKLEVEVLSTYSNVGFVIDEITLDRTLPTPPPPVQTSPCRPILVNVSPRSYSRVSPITDGNGYYHAGYNGSIIPVQLLVDGSVFGIYSRDATVNLTQYYTDGNQHNISFRETSRHQTGYHDYQVPDYNSPHMVSIAEWDTVDVYNKKGVKTGTRSVITGYHLEQRGWNTKYGGTLNDYGGPNSWSGSPSQIGPCFNYKLSSSINSFSEKVEPGANISVYASVNNSINVPSIPHTKSKSTKWQISKIVIPPNSSLPSYKSGGDNSLDPCSYFSNGYSCGPARVDGSTVFSSWGSSSTSLSYNFPVPDVTAGTKYCFAFSLHPSQSDPLHYSFNSWGGDLWNHALFNPSNNCVVVVKKPKTQVLSGDLIVGRQIGSTANLTSNVNTSTSIKSGNVYGSWVEYGIFATNRINGAASDSAYVNPASASVCARLSSSNNGNTACNYYNISSSPLGQYFTNRSIPSVANSFPIVAATPTTPATPMLSGSINLDNYVSATAPASNSNKTYGATSDLTINAASSNSTTVAKGKWMVINATGHKVTINSNIRYTSERLYSSKDIPQVVIIADQIDITDNVSGPNKVTNLDTWLIATNSINTCSSVPMGTGSGTNLSSQVCNDKLTVNGPVMTNKLYLRRTAGSGTGAINSGDPAEVFNLRADAYMWSYERAKKSSVIKSVYTVELAPRF